MEVSSNDAVAGAIHYPHRVDCNDIMSRVAYLVILCDLENKESLASGSRKLKELEGG
jgi:hypothetical protein